MCFIGLGILGTQVLKRFTKENTENVFKGFIQADEMIMTFNDIVDSQTTLAEVKILREIKKDKAEKLSGYKNVASEISTYFEAEVLSNYSNNLILNEKIIIKQVGTCEWQIEGDPLYEVGDALLIVLWKGATYDFYIPYGGNNGTFYISEDNGEKYINRTTFSLSDINIDPVFINKNEKVIYKNKSIENPVHFSQRFKLNDFVEAYNAKYKEKYNSKEKKER